MIEKRGNKWVLLSADGEVLGTHDTREEAEAQERAIEASKHSKSKTKKYDDGGNSHETSGESPEKTLADFLPYPILTIGKTKNEGMEITEDIYNEILQYNHKVHEAPIVKKPHEDTQAGFKSKGREGDALGWIKELGEVEVDGRKWIAITDLKPSSPEYEAEIVRCLSGPMKLNSPELQPLSKLLVELYGPEKTKQWPGAHSSKHFLRRVNLYGDSPVAQFNMPQSNLSDGNDTYTTIDLKEFEPMPKNKLNLSENPNPDEQKAVADDKEKKNLAAGMKCPSCGKAYSEGKYCPECGTALKSETDLAAEEEARKVAEQQAAAASQTAEAAKANTAVAGAGTTGTVKPENGGTQITITASEWSDLQKDIKTMKTQLAEKDKQIIAATTKANSTEYKLAELAKEKRAAEVEGILDQKIRDGEIFRAHRDMILQLAELADEVGSQRTIKLSEGTDPVAYSAEAVIEAFRVPVELTAGKIKVYAEPTSLRGNSNKPLTLQQDDLIHKIIADKKLDPVKDYEHAHGLAVQAQPALFRKAGRE